MTMFAFVLLAAFAQPQASPSDVLAWEISAPTLAEAQGYRYDAEIDGVVVVLQHTCAAVTLPSIQCEAPLPPLATGAHTARARAVSVADGVETPGPWSEPLLQFSLRVIPNQPVGFSIRPRPE
jgi:hypothetical protein